MHLCFNAGGIKPSELPSIVLVSHAVERPLYAHHLPYENLVIHQLPRKYITL